MEKIKKISNKLFIKKSIWIFIFLAFYNNVFTQVELESYINLATEKNENLKALHQNYLVALSKVNQVNILPNPEINLGVMLPKMQGHTGINRFNLGAMQSFPWFGILKAKKDLALAQAEVKNKNVPIASLEIIYHLKKTWLKIYELEKKKEFSTINLQLLDRLEDVTLSNIEAGKSSAINVVKINLKKEKIKTELALLENQKIAPLATFNQLLQSDLNQAIDIKSNLNFAILPDIKNDFSVTNNQPHPIIQKLNIEQQVASKSLKINDLNRKPTFGIGFEWTYVQKYPNISFDANGRDMKVARARVTLPIYTKQYRAKTQEEEQKIIAIDHQKKEIISQFSMIIEQAKAEHESAKIKIDLYEKQKRLTRSAIEILEGNFSTSGKGFEELLQMQMNLVDYDVMILEAIVMSHLAVAKIEKIIL
ncbi:MAG: TolC family protein [Saprospiraceae bacterium]|nr:TolC family protein [Saprospiraceae bacterium]